LFLLGKLGNRREHVNALGGLTFLNDSLSGLAFLVDTGAAVSVLPHHASPSAAQGPALAGADGKGISSWGKVYKSVCFNGRIFLDVPFILAAVSKPILGADFFATHHLLVDTSSHSVLDAETLLPIGGKKEPGSGSGSGSEKNRNWSRTCLRFLLRLETSLPNILVLSVMAPQHHALSMVLSIPLRLRAGRFLRKAADWIRTSSGSQKRNFAHWKKCVLSAVQTQDGVRLYTWYLSQTVLSALVAITAG
jgi:hypothetical protein